MYADFAATERSKGSEANGLNGPASRCSGNAISRGIKKVKLGQIDAQFHILSGLNVDTIAKHHCRRLVTDLHDEHRLRACWFNQDDLCRDTGVIR